MASNQGLTFFSTIKKSFADVPVERAKDNAIPTTEFLEAAESLCTLFGGYEQLPWKRISLTALQTSLDRSHSHRSKMTCWAMSR